MLSAPCNSRVVTRGGFGPLAIPLVDVRQLYRQDRRLQTIESAIDTLHHMVVLVFGAGSVAGVTATFVGQFIVIRNNCASVTIRAQVFAGIKTERSCDAKCADPFTMQFGKMRLCAILDQIQIVERRK